MRDYAHFSRALIITQWPPFGARLCSFITHLLDFARFHRLLYVTWCKITGQLLRSNPRLRRYLSSEYFRRKETKPAEKSQKAKSCTVSSFLVYNKEKRTRFVVSSDSNILKSILKFKYCTGKYKKVNKISCQLADTKINGGGGLKQMNTLLAAGMSADMSLVERLS